MIKKKKIIIIILTIRMNYYTSVNYLFLAPKRRKFFSSLFKNILVNCPLLFASSFFFFSPPSEILSSPSPFFSSLFLPFFLRIFPPLSQEFSLLCVLFFLDTSLLFNPTSFFLSPLFLFFLSAPLTLSFSCFVLFCSLFFFF